jgi:F-type H+-transporting ATPase subunit b
LAEVNVRFETAPDLISGIELTTNGQKIAWSIADYLASLEKNVGELLKEKDKREAKAEPKPQAKAEPEPEAAPKTEAKSASKPEEPKPEPQHK